MKLSESNKRFKLDDINLQTMLELLDDLQKETKKIRKKKSYFFKEVPITTIDGQTYMMPVWIDTNLDTYAAMGRDEQRPIGIDNTNLIVNPLEIKSGKHFYNSLYHEFLHAVDPTLTSKPSEKYLKKYGDPITNPEKYYSHGIELRGITGEFFEALVNEFKERSKYIKDEDDKELLLNSLDNIVSFFNELRPLSPLSYDIIDKMNGDYDLDDKFKSQLSSMLKQYPKVSELIPDTPNIEPYFLEVINSIRVYNPKGWKMFLNMLYTTKNEIEDNLNSRITESQIKRLVQIVINSKNNIY